jgi:ferredoxin
MRDKIWWRGLEKNKLYFKRCRPVMARYLGCGVCMKVCPIQKYGLKNVMEHYADTGQVLGKGTHDLEGYSLEGKGYFGPGEMPVFDRDFFDMPTGSIEDYAFSKFKEKAEANGEVTEESMAELAKHMNRSLKQVYDTADMIRLGLDGDELDIDADYI